MPRTATHAAIQLDAAEAPPAEAAGPSEAPSTTPSSQRESGITAGRRDPSSPDATPAATAKAWAEARSAASRTNARPPENRFVYYGCASVALLCAIAWLVAGLVNHQYGEVVLAAIWLGTVPIFVAAGRRAAAGR